MSLAISIYLFPPLHFNRSLEVKRVMSKIHQNRTAGVYRGYAEDSRLLAYDAISLAQRFLLRGLRKTSLNHGHAGTFKKRGSSKQEVLRKILLTNHLKAQSLLYVCVTCFNIQDFLFFAQIILVFFLVVYRANLTANIGCFSKQH